MIGIVTLLVLAYVLISKRADDAASIVLAVGSGLAGGVAAIAIGYLLSSAYILLFSGSLGGVFGRHVFSISEDGFHERTEVNESIQKWSGIQAVYRTRSQIMIRFSGYLFHIIPRRAFESEADYRSFGDKVYEYWQQST
jgi:hypothetical protein